jgi:hypothetical protein
MEDGQMRKVLPVVVAFALLAMLPTDALAWYCRASSATGAWGWGRAAYQAVANRIALNNCAVRTPRGYVCYTNYCTPNG